MDFEVVAAHHRRPREPDGTAIAIAITIAIADKVRTE
jgi:hypothetical protein